MWTLLVLVLRMDDAWMMYVRTIIKGVCLKFERTSERGRAGKQRQNSKHLHVLHPSLCYGRESLAQRRYTIYLRQDGWFILQMISAIEGKSTPVSTGITFFHQFVIIRDFRVDFLCIWRLIDTFGRYDVGQHHLANLYYFPHRKIRIKFHVLHTNAYLHMTYIYETISRVDGEHHSFQPIDSFRGG